MNLPRASESAPDILRLVTYNIHKGIGGVDRKYRPERIVDVLNHCRPDLVLLQEVDEGVPRSRHHRQVDLLGEALGLHHRCFYPNVRLRRGHYGNALLSRFPLDHTENIDLTIPPKKRRGALHARLTIENGHVHQRIWLFNAHLGLAELERRAQLRRVLRWLDHHRLHHDTGIVLAGDFNDVWSRLGPRVLQPAGYRNPRPALATFPAVRPLRPLDRIFVRGPLEIVRSYRGRMKIARQASDHLPLISILRLGNHQR